MVSHQPTCDGGTGEAMVGAFEVTLQQAQNAGKTACPVCAGGTQQAAGNTNYLSGNTLLSYVRTLSSDGSGLMVYARPEGPYFHITSDLRRFDGRVLCQHAHGAAVRHRALSELLLAGPRHRLLHGKRHLVPQQSTCDGGTGSSMRNATGMPLAVALVMGKGACPKCIGSFSLPNTGGGTTGQGTTGGATDGTVYVYATENGRYYHINSTCDGGTGSEMRNAQRVTLLSMLQIGREPCPVCCSSANRTVYATPGGTYYHSTPPVQACPALRRVRLRRRWPTAISAVRIAGAPRAERAAKAAREIPAPAFPA